MARRETESVPLSAVRFRLKDLPRRPLPPRTQRRVKWRATHVHALLNRKVIVLRTEKQWATCRDQDGNEFGCWTLYLRKR